MNVPIEFLYDCRRQCILAWQEAFYERRPYTTYNGLVYKSDKPGRPYRLPKTRNYSLKGMA